MNYLIDTHVFVWTATAPERLSSTAREIITNPRNALMISTASVWEGLLKAAKGKLGFTPGLGLAEQFEREIRLQNLLPLPIQIEHVAKAYALPHHHSDPFDRLIVAQALVEGVPLITADEALQAYPVRVIW